MRILSGGNVGIGTTSPGQKLEVKDGALLLSNSGTAQQLQLQGTSTGVSTFAAGAQGSTSINYVLPTSQGFSGSRMQNDGSGNLSWSRVGQVLFARKTANQDYTSTNLADDSHLSISLDTSATYVFDAFLSFGDITPDGINAKIAFTVPTGST